MRFPSKRFRLMRRVLAYVWAFPITLIGLLLGAGALLLGATARRNSGILEIASPHASAGRWRSRWLKRQAFVAITLGHVVLGRDHDVLDQWRAHEQVHVAQTERWGPLFPAAYALASLVAWVRGLHPYWDNAFEKQAQQAPVGNASMTPSRPSQPYKP